MSLSKITAVPYFVNYIWLHTFKTKVQNLSAVMFFYNTSCYNMDLAITRSYCGSLNFFGQGILQRNYRKMTINGHFPIIPL